MNLMSTIYVEEVKAFLFYHNVIKIFIVAGEAVNGSTYNASTFGRLLNVPHSAAPFKKVFVNSHSRRIETRKRAIS